MPDEQRFPGELFPWPQAAGPDEGGAHAVRDRPATSQAKLSPMNSTSLAGHPAAASTSS